MRLAVDAPKSPRAADVPDAWLLRPEGRPLFVFAHQDDELVLAGLIRRALSPAARFVWWTNGDGLAPGSGMSPESYARVRVADAAECVARLGGDRAQKVDLESSEIENYRKLTEVALGGPAGRAARRYFLSEAERVEREVRAAQPDRVFLLAWQGGHPEHDLVHLMTARAVQRLRRETGAPIPLVQCPAYEYTIACAMRFKPWFVGDRRSITLSSAELAAKQSCFEAYPSQAALFGKFQRVIETIGLATLLTEGERTTRERWLAKEEFGVVDPELDYARSTHRLDRLNYMFDDFEGTAIRFSTMIRPLARELLD